MVRDLLSRLYGGYQSRLFQTGTSILGSGLLALGALRLLRLGYTNFLRPSRFHIFQHSVKGSWALVTGASDGIGRAFAEDLLRRGFHVLLHGRNSAKLSRLRDELASRYPKQEIRTVIADAGSFDHPEQAVFEAVQQLPGDLTILVNNVGGQSTNAPYILLADTTSAEVDDLINLNVRFAVQLTRLLTPILQSHSPALILNSGSIAGVVGMGFISIYSASKSFVNGFTRALRMEARSERTGIQVTTAIIGNTISSSNTTHSPGITITSADCARSCLDQVGHGEAFISPSWRHSLPLALMSMMPEAASQDVTMREMKVRVEEEKQREKQH